MLAVRVWTSIRIEIGRIAPYVRTEKDGMSADELDNFMQSLRDCSASPVDRHVNGCASLCCDAMPDGRTDLLTHVVWTGLTAHMRQRADDHIRQSSLHTRSAGTLLHSLNQALTLSATDRSACANLAMVRTGPFCGRDSGLP